MGNLHSLVGTTNLRRLAWLAFLGPLFFVSYNLANALAAAREPGVPSIVFAWERAIPFLAWTIVPYWSSDILYVLSFWACRTKVEIDRHGRRLVAIQLISVLFFVLFPLKMTYFRPVFDGFFASLFDLLSSFDKPYNQAPSLHISLAYIIWRQIRGRMAGAWFLLVAISTLTTWQHHFIDVPTGLWVGVLVVALFPDEPRHACRRPRLASYYALGSVALTVAGFWLAWWLLLWPAFSLSLVAAAYWTGRVELLGKRDGRMPVWMFPYWAGAWINSSLWRSKPNEVAGGVWVGRPDMEGFASVVDLTGELPIRADRYVPMLDLAPPSVDQLTAAVAAIESLEGRRPTLVCCALGYSRSAAAVSAWLIASGQADSTEVAIGVVRQARPRVVFSRALKMRLIEWASDREGFLHPRPSD